MLLPEDCLAAYASIIDLKTTAEKRKKLAGLNSICAKVALHIEKLEHESKSNSAQKVIDALVPKESSSSSSSSSSSIGSIFGGRK